MANPRIRLTQTTMDAVAELGQRCGIDDPDTVIKILIRKYGDDLIHLLAPSSPIRDSLSQPVPALQQPDPVPPKSVPVLATATTKAPLSGFFDSDIGD
jgi:hypothetical protein